MKGAVKLTNHGSFSTDAFLKEIRKRDFAKWFKPYGEAGVAALQESTPKRTGRTAASWTYEIVKSKEGFSIVWKNTNLAEGDKGPPVVLLLYYGHVTNSGKYVSGRDFITPAIKPIFDDIEKQSWAFVQSLNKQFKG